MKIVNKIITMTLDRKYNVIKIVIKGIVDITKRFCKYLPQRYEFLLTDIAAIVNTYKFS